MNSKKKALGIDIGGTKILYGIIEESGKISGEVKKISTPKNATDIFNTLKIIIEENNEKIDAIGISSAGAVNIENTKVISSTPNLPKGYNDIDFSKLSDKKVYVENDANCAAAAEYKIGSGKGSKTMLMITLGTGIGGGLIHDGKLFRGSTGNALEVGSMKIPASDKIKCTCGRLFCWEAFASGTGLKNLATEMASTSAEFETCIYNYKKPQDLTTYDIIEGKEKNDEFSKKVFENWVECIQTGLISLTNIFNPDCIVISGGMCKFVDPKLLERNINKETVVTDVKIKLAKTGNDAGMIGAGVLALKV